MLYCTVEPGLLNSPMFLLAPVSYIVPLLLRDSASELVAFLAGCVGMLLSCLLFAHTWYAASVGCIFNAVSMRCFEMHGVQVFYSCLV